MQGPATSSDTLRARALPRLPPLRSSVPLLSAEFHGEFFTEMLAWKWRILGVTAAAGSARCAYVAHYYRPIPDYPGDEHKATRRRLVDVNNEVSHTILRHVKYILCSQMRGI